jgi:hypothetical protein
MARLKLLLISLVVALAMDTPPAIALHSETGCLSWNAAHFAECQNPPPATGVVNGGGVDLSTGFDTGGAGSVSDAGAPGSTPTPTVGLPFVRDGFAVNCPLCDPNLVVRISDLVNFPAAVPGQGMEPNGWAINGLPANFMAQASMHARTGMLLGFPAEVRFAPTRFHWDVGDGTGIDSATGGARWAALGVPEFSATATSHIFRSTGRHNVVLSVVYSAEYRVGGQPWRPVQGALTIAAPPITVVVSTTSTVLVGQDCTANPAGPGC